MSSISFLRASEEITSSWIQNAKEEKANIGRVNYALRETIMHFERRCDDDLSFVPVGGPNTSNESESGDQAILWGEKNDRSIIQPISLNKNLQAMLAVVNNNCGTQIRFEEINITQ